MEERDGFLLDSGREAFGGVEMVDRMTGGRQKREEGDLDALGRCGRRGGDGGEIRSICEGVDNPDALGRSGYKGSESSQTPFGGVGCCADGTSLKSRCDI